jgi:pimeloyl-ACP methyl ester carboxylesterase
MAATRVPEAKGLAKPALLCLHGAGSSSSIFKFQLAKIRFALKHDFDFVFVEGPAPAPAGPGMLPTFASAGPFKRWFGLDISQRDAEIDNIHHAVRGAIHDWSQVNSASRILGVIGFSQGALASTLLLWEQQMGHLPWLPEMHFAVLICCDFVDEMTVLMKRDAQEKGVPPVLDLHTLHMHGLADPFLKRGRKMLSDHFDPGRTTLLDFDGGHHCPNQKKDVDEAARLIIDLAKRTSRGSQ